MRKFKTSSNVSSNEIAQMRALSLLGGLLSVTSSDVEFYTSNRFKTNSEAEKSQTSTQPECHQTENSSRHSLNETTKN
jgi:hypothetical protein